MDDLVSYLLSKFQEELTSNRNSPVYDLVAPLNAHQIQLVDQVVQAFAQFCRDHLKNNPPVTIRFAEMGTVMQLADGTRVTVAPSATLAPQEDPLPQQFTGGFGHMR